MVPSAICDLRYESVTDFALLVVPITGNTSLATIRSHLNCGLPMNSQLLQSDDDRPTMTTEQAADYLGCSAASLRWGRSKGRWGPAFHRGISREVRYSKSDLDSFIKSRRIDPAATEQEA
jgi:hypothetical protein